MTSPPEPVTKDWRWEWDKSGSVSEDSPEVRVVVKLRERSECYFEAATILTR